MIDFVFDWFNEIREHVQFKAIRNTYFEVIDKSYDFKQFEHINCFNQSVIGIPYLIQTDEINMCV